MSSTPPVIRANQIFVALGRTIVRGKEHIATAVSVNMAKRICNALNFYKPNKNGN